LIPEKLDEILRAWDVDQLFDQSKFVEIDEKDEYGEESSEDDSSDDEEEQLSIEEMIARLQKDLRCLTDLGVSLDNPVLDLESNIDVPDTSTVDSVESRQDNIDHTNLVEVKENTRQAIQASSYQETELSQLQSLEDVDLSSSQIGNSTVVDPFDAVAQMSSQSTKRARHKGEPDNTLVHAFIEINGSISRTSLLILCQFLQPQT
jgi:hypothetical protein